MVKIRLNAGKRGAWLIVGILFILVIIIWTPLIFELKRIHKFEKTDYNCELKDPTYDEMKEFLINDTINLNKYNDEKSIFLWWKKYNCIDFAADVKKSAIEKGIRCACVYIEFTEQEIGHMIVAFKTIDKGIIFIEPQSDQEAYIKPGAFYFGEIIKKVKIYWPIIKKYES